MDRSILKYNTFKKNYDDFKKKIFNYIVYRIIQFIINWNFKNYNANEYYSPKIRRINEAISICIKKL